jgi:hypothetical protein
VAFTQRTLVQPLDKNQLSVAVIKAVVPFSQILETQVEVGSCRYVSESILLIKAH